MRNVIAASLLWIGMAHAQDETAVFTFRGGEKLRALVDAVKALERGWPQSEAEPLASNLGAAGEAWAQMLPEVRERPLAVKYHDQLATWERRVKAARRKDRAAKAMARGRDAAEASPAAAKEYYQLALDAWDDAFELAPELRGQTIRIDAWKGESRTAGDWRALAAKKMGEL